MHPWLNWIEHRPPKAGTARSNRAGCASLIKNTASAVFFIELLCNPRFGRARVRQPSRQAKRSTGEPSRVPRRHGGFLIRRSSESVRVRQKFNRRMRRFAK